MKLSELIRGLEILRPHYKNGDGYHTGAEHDQFYAYATQSPLSAEEVAEMRALGWFQIEGDDEDPYDPEVGWMAYT